MNQGGKVAVSEIEGGNKDRVVKNANNQGANLAVNVERENEVTDLENIGLSISDPKRRRTEEKIANGPQVLMSPGDEIMLDNQSDTTDNQKNSILAGSVGETRLAL